MWLPCLNDGDLKNDLSEGYLENNSHNVTVLDKQKQSIVDLHSTW